MHRYRQTQSLVHCSTCAKTKPAAPQASMIHVRLAKPGVLGFSLSEEKPITIHTDIKNWALILGRCYRTYIEILVNISHFLPEYQLCFSLNTPRFLHSVSILTWQPLKSKEVEATCTLKKVNNKNGARPSLIYTLKSSHFSFCNICKYLLLLLTPSLVRKLN